MDYQEYVEMGGRARRETEDFINSYIHDQRKRWPIICRSGRVRQGAVQRAAFGACSGIGARLQCPLFSLGNGDGPREGRVMPVAEQFGPKAG